MMGGRFLLDTNIIIAIFAYDRSVLEALKAANEVFVASIVLGGTVLWCVQISPCRY